MKKLLFGIFAHPDDEAFGPSGTLLKLVSEGIDLHLICLTDGESGQNPDSVEDLGATRLAEWRTAGRTLGSSSNHALHYPDGQLENVSQTEVDEKVKDIVVEVLASYDQPSEVSFMTFESQGLTGHKDHIFAAELTVRLASEMPTNEVWYFCLNSDQAPLEGTAYYQPRGREDSYINLVVDVTPWKDKKNQVMDAHYTQRSDAKTMKALAGSHESFHVEKLS